MLSKKKVLLQRATKKDFLHRGSFQEAIAPVLTIAQFFGLLPVSGIQSDKAISLVFSWINFRTIYCIILIFFHIFYCLIVYFWVFSQPIQFKTTEPIIFYTTVVLISIKFLLLARKWPKIMRHWENVEEKLPSYQSQLENSALAKKIKITTFVVLMLSLAEHLLSMLSTLYFVTTCPSRSDPIESYFAIQSDQLFYIIDFSIWVGILGKYLNILGTFIWNFGDLFVMIISIGLSSRFKQLNENLFKIKGQETSHLFWKEQHLHYRSLCVLCDKVDDAISAITLISFSNNLYFICVKLLRSIYAKPSYAHTLYFWFSLSFLLGRTIMISLYSADIADQAKKPLTVFRCIPRKSWCKEVKRFSDEVASDLIALSGMKFFYITRSFVLSVAGTIVTYELVLIQYNKNDPVSNC